MLSVWRWRFYNCIRTSWSFHESSTQSQWGKDNIALSGPPFVGVNVLLAWIHKKMPPLSISTLMQTSVNQHKRIQTNEQGFCWFIDEIWLWMFVGSACPRGSICILSCFVWFVYCKTWAASLRQSPSLPTFCTQKKPHTQLTLRSIGLIYKYIKSKYAFNTNPSPPYLNKHSFDLFRDRSRLWSSESSDLSKFSLN